MEADGTRNSFTATAAIDKKASWTTLLAAEDGTKVVVSPYIQNPTDTVGEARTQGGGNETPDGIEIIVGKNPTTFAGVMRGVPQDVIKAMKELECEAASGNLGVYLFDGNGNIEALQDATTETTYYPIPIRSLFISDKAHGGLEEQDYNNIQWAYEPNYSDNLDIIAASDFNPVKDLQNATE